MFLAYFLRDNSRVTACYSVAYVDTGMTLLYVHMRSWSRYKHNYVFINVRGFLCFDFIFVCVCVLMFACSSCICIWQKDSISSCPKSSFRGAQCVFYPAYLMYGLVFRTNKTTVQHYLLNVFSILSGTYPARGIKTMTYGRAQVVGP